MPTEAQLQQVSMNVGRMIDLSNHLHDFMQDPTNEVYLELSADNGTDPGYEFICALLETIFALAALVEFPGAAVVGAFLPVLFSSASPTDVDQNLKVQFGAAWARLSKTFLDANDQLAPIHDNPAQYWDSTFTSPVTGKKVLVSSLADPGVEMPDRRSDPFQKITDRVVGEYKYGLTAWVVPTIYYVYFSDYYSNWQYGEAAQFFKDASDYIVDYPAYFFKYRSVFVVKGGQKFDAIQFYNFSLVKTAGSIYSTPSDALCKWLFKDTGYGVETNPDGIATRSAVFFRWGLRVYFPDGEPFGLDDATYPPDRASAAPQELKPGETPGVSPEPAASLPAAPAPKGPET